jgi:GNAT superfamily N-acetyltransferase
VDPRSAPGGAEREAGRRGLSLTLTAATPDDARAIAALRTAVAERLTRESGLGHWSPAVSERGVLHGMRTSRVLAARDGGRIVATLRLATKKPWAIDTTYFTGCGRALYLTDMAVAPDVQRRGIGRRCLEEARRLAREWPAGAIRLDAYDAPAGAGGFYVRCGFREVGRVTYRKTPLIYYELLV